MKFDKIKSYAKIICDSIIIFNYNHNITLFKYNQIITPNYTIFPKKRGNSI